MVAPNVGITAATSVLLLCRQCSAPYPAGPCCVVQWLQGGLTTQAVLTQQGDIYYLYSSSRPGIAPVASVSTGTIAGVTWSSVPSGIKGYWGLEDPSVVPVALRLAPRDASLLHLPLVERFGTSGISPTVWSHVMGARVSTACTAEPGGAMTFSASTSSDRMAITNAIDVSACSSVLVSWRVGPAQETASCSPVAHYMEFAYVFNALAPAEGGDTYHTGSGSFLLGIPTTATRLFLFMGIGYWRQGMAAVEYLSFTCSTYKSPPEGSAAVTQGPIKVLAAGVQGELAAPTKQYSFIEVYNFYLVSMEGAQELAFVNDYLQVGLPWMVPFGGNNYNKMFVSQKWLQDGLTTQAVLTQQGDIFYVYSSNMPAVERSNNVWAFLASTAEGFGDYNYEADMCALYQQLHAMGVPDDHIVVMMSDVVANSKSNPHKGEIINQPLGPNVYAGVPLDYTGRLVTPKNYVDVLAGNAPAGGSGKKLASTAKDTVFLYFSGPGMWQQLRFPGEEVLRTAELAAAINGMAQKGRFRQLLVTVEGSESGSHFYNTKLPANTYVTTATTPAELSYRWMPSNDLGVFLSDVFSWNMLDYVRQPGAYSRTLQDQFNDTSSQISVDWTPPCQYGDASIARRTFRDVFEISNATAARAQKPAARTGAVAQDSAGLVMAVLAHQSRPSRQTREALDRELAVRSRLDGLHARIVAGAGISEAELEGAQQPRGKVDCSSGVSSGVSDCLGAAIDAFMGTCGHKHQYADSVLHRFHAACDVAVARGSVGELVSAIKGDFIEVYDFQLAPMGDAQELRFSDGNLQVQLPWQFSFGGINYDKIVRQLCRVCSAPYPAGPCCVVQWLQGGLTTQAVLAQQGDIYYVYSGSRYGITSDASVSTGGVAGATWMSVPGGLTSTWVFEDPAVAPVALRLAPRDAAPLKLPRSVNIATSEVSPAVWSHVLGASASTACSSQPGGVMTFLPYSNVKRIAITNAIDVSHCSAVLVSGHVGPDQAPATCSPVASSISVARMDNELSSPQWASIRMGDSAALLAIPETTARLFLMLSLGSRTGMAFGEDLSVVCAVTRPLTESSSSAPHDWPDVAPAAVLMAFLLAH
eukprot:m51a1_g10130 putative legumain (1095) ;mRNA; f:19-6671